jgi:hypothetical protein
MTPVAAPCDYQIREKKGWLDVSRIRLLGSGGLVNIENTLHESIGLVYESIRTRSNE